MSALGNSIAGIVWPWIVLERTGDPAAAGLVAAEVAVPSVIFAFLGGYLIDTVGRKPMSVISDIISGASVAGVVLVDQTLGLTIAWFIALGIIGGVRSEEHTSELQSRGHLVCRLLLEQKQLIAVERTGLKEIVTAAAYTVGSLTDTLHTYPHIETVLVARGHAAQRVTDLV